MLLLRTRNTNTVIYPAQTTLSPLCGIPSFASYSVIMYSSLVPRSTTLCYTALCCLCLLLLLLAFVAILIYRRRHADGKAQETWWDIEKRAGIFEEEANDIVCLTFFQSANTPKSDERCDRITQNREIRLIQTISQVRYLRSNPRIRNLPVTDKRAKPLRR